MNIRLFIAGMVLILQFGLLGSGVANQLPKLADLQHRAVQQRLVDRPEWRALLHLRPLGDSKVANSLIRSPEFFIASDGSSSASAELSETVAELHKALSEAGMPDSEGFLCRYPARAEWLVKQLLSRQYWGIARRCPETEQLLKEFSGGKLYLVFAASDPDQPASVFGHSFFVLESPALSERSGNLAGAIDFSALPATETGGFEKLGYLLQGAFGELDGKFTFGGYDQFLKRYGLFQNRDLWEYELNLDEQELELLVLHLRELLPLKLGYRFFTENCSRLMLDLLQLARPDSLIADRFDDARKLYTAPIDTIKATKAAGMVVNSRYIASMKSQTSYLTQRLTPAQKQWVLDHLAGSAGVRDTRWQAAAESQRGCVLDAAIALIQAYEYARRPHGAVTTYIELLTERSVQMRCEASVTKEEKAPEDPASGHPLRRLQFGVAYTNSEPELVIGWRPVYHDFLDPPGGHPVEAGSVEIFDVTLAISEQELRLNKLRLIGMESWKPLSKISGGMSGSWAFSVDIRGGSPGMRSNNSLIAQGGWGPGWQAKGNHQLSLLGWLEGLAGSGQEKGHRVSAGGSFRWRWNNGHSFNHSLETYLLAESGGSNIKRLEYAGQWHFSPADGLRLNLRWQQEAGHIDRQVLLSLLRYF